MADAAKSWLRADKEQIMKTKLYPLKSLSLITDPGTSFNASLLHRRFGANDAQMQESENKIVPWTGWREY